MELESRVQGKEPVRRLQQASKDGRLEEHSRSFFSSSTSTTTRHTDGRCGLFLSSAFHVAGYSETTSTTARREATGNVLLVRDSGEELEGTVTTPASNEAIERRRQLPSSSFDRTPQKLTIEPNSAAQSLSRTENRREALEETIDARVPVIMVSESSIEAEAKCDHISSLKEANLQCGEVEHRPSEKQKYTSKGSRCVQMQATKVLRKSSSSCQWLIITYLQLINIICFYTSGKYCAVLYM